MIPIENIRLSDRARTQLITMKRRTGIQHWNVLCRWALALSLAQETRPPDENIPADSTVEMTWKTFSGGDEALYWGLLLARAEQDGVAIEKQALSHYFRLHLHRGISYLAGSNGPQSIEDLVGLSVSAT
jgi:DNA sulfur modification protein DndE